LYVCPGFIDLHVHTYWGVSHYGMDAVDANCLARGATTVVDAGSAGADTYDGMRRYVIDAHATRILSLLHISRVGMLSGDYADIPCPAVLDVARAVEVVERHRDTIVGIKIRLTVEEGIGDPGLGLLPLRRAHELAQRVGLPLMVHPPDAVGCRSIDDILDFLGPGDILTHCFHPFGCGILDGKGRVREAVWRARERGVIFDVGHGMASFTWNVAEAAYAQGFIATVVSSDLHAYNIEVPVVDLPTTASKCLHLGMSLGDVIERMTLAPATAIGRQDDLGTLRTGACADAVVFAMEEGQFDLFDASGDTVDDRWVPTGGTGKKRIAERRLAPVTVVRAGEVVT
jgi:dihydroorotase